MNIYAFTNTYMDAITREERDHEYESKWTGIWEERRDLNYNFKNPTKQNKTKLKSQMRNKKDSVT